jgi:menaquinone-9 beta-reductase
MEPRSNGADARFDVIVVGSGPAGSCCAYQLARLGARVALVDRVNFPRDKACGDLLSPRTIEALDALGIAISGAAIGDMSLVGPGGGAMPLPWPRGAAYPAEARAIPRSEFDDQLRVAALEAGAEFFQADVSGVVDSSAGGHDVNTTDGRRFHASYVVGADGSLSRVAEAAGLVQQGEALWGFALRYYVKGHLERPLIVYWEPTRGKAFPGYGWAFPNIDGRINLGLGVSLGGARTGADLVSREMPGFVRALQERGLIGSVSLSSETRRGGWLKMGLAGTTPARGHILLVGDAAGLVNPLAGEGISGAILSGVAAAEAIGAGNGDAGARYVDFLRNRYARFYTRAAALQSFMAEHPRLFGLTGRVLTAPGVRGALSPGWSMYWNDLIDGAGPGGARSTARSIEAVTGVLTAPSRLRRRTERHLKKS